MGTTWRVLAVAPPPGLAAAIQARLDGLVAEMSHWDAGSRLSRFNCAAAGTWHALPPDFAQVMDTGLAVADASGSAFDPAIGRLVDLQDRKSTRLNSSHVSEFRMPSSA